MSGILGLAPVVTNGGRVRAALATVVRAVVPVVLALVAGALIILLMGRDPLAFYGGIVRYGLLGDNWMRSLVLMAPLLLIAVGLIVAFRGQLWNLGYGGQFLLGAVVVSGAGPALFEVVPWLPATLALLIGSALAGALWSLVPALLKARYGTNEIITSLVMSFIGIGVVNLLIKGPLKDQAQAIPQTRVLANADMLPYIPGTRIHVGVLLAIVIAIALQYVLSRTSLGLRVDVFGAGAKVADHVGIDSRRMVILLFAVSGGLIGLAGGVDILGHESYQRANWDPMYGMAVMPFVFLARLSPLAVIPFVGFYAVLATGGILAAQQSGLDVDFLLVIVGLILVFMTITELVGSRRALGRSYLPPGLARSVTGLLSSIGTGRAR